MSFNYFLRVHGLWKSIYVLTKEFQHWDPLEIVGPFQGSFTFAFQDLMEVFILTWTTTFFLKLIYLVNEYLIWSFWVSSLNACINVKLQIQPWATPTLSYYELDLILLFHHPLFDFDQNIYQRVLNAYILNWMVGLVILFMNE